MKSKFSFAFAAMLVLSVFFSGCGQDKAVKNEFGWYVDLDACMTAAKKSGKKIIMLFSRDDSDHVSAGFKEKIFFTEEFMPEFSKQYELCNIDFSLSRFQAVFPKDDADKETLKKASELKKQFDKDMRVAAIYGASVTPAVFILSADGFVMSEITYIEAQNTKEFAEMLESYAGEIALLDEEIESLKKAKGMDRVSAINALYDGTKTSYRYLLKDYIQEVIKLDKDNQSGLVGKYILADASSKSMDFYLSRQPEKAPDAYVKAAEHPYLSTEQKQQAYYAAAYITGSQDPSLETSEQIIGYLTAAIDVDPSSNLGKQCKKMLERTKEIYERQKAIDAQRAAEESEE